MNTNGICDRFEREGILRLERGLALDTHFDECPACEVARHKYENLLASLPIAGPEIEPLADWQSRVLRATAANGASRGTTWFAGWGRPLMLTAMAGATAMMAATFLAQPQSPQFAVEAETHAAAPVPDLVPQEETDEAPTGHDDATNADPLPAPRPVAPRIRPRQTAPVPQPVAPKAVDDDAPLRVPAKPAPTANNAPSHPEFVASLAPQVAPAVRASAVRVIRPDKLYGLAIKYPPAAMRAKIQGETSVQCTVRADGRNTNCRILKSLPYLDNAVIRAVEAARSEPIRVDGKPVDNSDHIWHITITLREIPDERTSARALPILNWN